MEGTDVCFAPVLSMAEAPTHPHNKERKAFVEIEGIQQPAPAPRFSDTPSAIQRPPPTLGEHSREILEEFGFSDEEVARLVSAGAVAQGEAKA